MPDRHKAFGPEDVNKSWATIDFQVMRGDAISGSLPDP
jgi:hypothetical protein